MRLALPPASSGRPVKASTTCTIAISSQRRTLYARVTLMMLLKGQGSQISCGHAFKAVSRAAAPDATMTMSATAAGPQTPR
eukprot:2430100-Alexandrium_andersonii.AAC.1